MRSVRPEAVVADAIQVRLGSQVVLRQLSIEARPGQVLALVGPNGAGKSTLLRALAGLLPLDQGRVSLGPLDSTSSPQAWAQQRGLCWSGLWAPFDYSVLEFVLMAGQARRPRLSLASGQERALALEALARVELDALASRGLMSLSAGERARAQLARLIHQDVPWWFMDEPLANLDVRHQGLAVALMRARCASGGGVIVALHQLDWVERVAQRVALLRRGQLVACGPLDQVMTPASLSQLYEVELSALQGPGWRAWFAAVPG